MLSITQRAGLFAVAVALPASLLAACSSSASSTPPSASASPSPTMDTSADTASANAAFAQLEAQYQAQLGIYAIDTGTGRTVAFQADNRFAYCSTLKALSAAVLLQTKSDAQLGQTVTYTSADLVDYSPVTSQHVQFGMTLTAVMAAAIEVSDNTAANLMFDQLDGPSGLQTALRSMGDTTTNVDRTEPTLNNATPGDTRDTSTARALTNDLRAFVLGDQLAPARRGQLTAWLQANTTGGPYIRAAVPAGWKVGDKTGNGDFGTRNDIAVLWPDHGAPIVISVLSNRGSENATSSDPLIADATKLALQELT